MDLRPGYREAPAPGLACVWVTAGAGRTRVLPDACVDVVWHAGHGAFVAGPDTVAHVAEHDDGTTFLGARLAPGTGSDVLGLPLHALRDQRVPLADVRPDLDALLPADLPPEDAAAVLAEIGIRRTSSGGSGSRGPDALVVAAAARLRASDARVARVAADLGLSDRQLRRRCEAAVGYGPKQLQRTLRLQRLLRLADAHPRPDLARLAADAGYADQPHLTNDCVRLTGLPPARLLAERRA